MDNNDRAAIVDALSNLAAAISHTVPDNKLLLKRIYLKYGKL